MAADYIRKPPHLPFVDEVELGVEADSEFVEERDIVCPLLRGEPINKALVHLRCSAEDVQVFADLIEHGWALDLHGDGLARVLQGGTVHLGEGSGSDGLIGYGGEELAEGAAELR